MEETNRKKDIERKRVVPTQSQRQVYQGQTKLPARSAAEARDSATAVVSPYRRVVVSMGISHIHFLRKSREVMSKSTTSAEMRFPTTGEFRTTDSSEKVGGASLDARVKDLDYDEGGSLGKKSRCSYQRGIGTPFEKTKTSRQCRHQQAVLLITLPKT